MSRTPTADHTHRVVCPEWTEYRTGLAAAQRWMVNVETTGQCRQLHTVEVRDGDAWTPLHLWRAQRILAAPVGPDPLPADVADGLIKCQGGWTPEDGARADRLAQPDWTRQQWLEELGPHKDATLTSDGRGARTDAWCTCLRGSTTGDGAWVRYERWTAQGRVAHGYVHQLCRFVLQTG